MIRKVALSQGLNYITEKKSAMLVICLEIWQLPYIIYVYSVVCVKTGVLVPAYSSEGKNY
jgi:hypothetical protein